MTVPEIVCDAGVIELTVIVTVAVAVSEPAVPVIV